MPPKAPQAGTVPRAWTLRYRQFDRQRAAAGRRAIQLDGDDPSAAHVAQQRQRIERVIPHVDHAHAAALAHGVVHFARGRVGLGQHDHDHVRSEVFG